MPLLSIDLYPGKVEMMIHPPVDTTGYTDTNLDELSDRAHRAIRSGLAKVAAGQDYKGTAFPDFFCG